MTCPSGLLVPYMWQRKDGGDQEEGTKGEVMYLPLIVGCLILAQKGESINLLNIHFH